MNSTSTRFMNVVNVPPTTAAVSLLFLLLEVFSAEDVEVHILSYCFSTEI